MTEARLLVEQAGPLTTIQDGGRPGYRRYGVAPSGPIDRLGFAAANALAGVAPGNAAIEISLSGLVLRGVAGEIGFALQGGGFCGELDGKSVASGILGPGTRLRIRQGTAGNWAYLALAGDIRCPRWLGSRATHALAGLGGGRVVAGQELVARANGVVPRQGEQISPMRDPIVDVRIVMGPQDRFFDADICISLLTAPFRASSAFDRMGMVLAGPPLIPNAVDMLSEPAVRGALQVDGKGRLTMLLSDHQTTGGYPKIAVVIGPDIDRVAQLAVDRQIRFVAVTPDTAILEAREWHARCRRYLTLLTEDISLEQRLLAANLVDGVVDARADEGGDAVGYTSENLS